MITAGFLRQKIKKIYERVVEECTELHISEYLAFLYEQASYSSPPHLRSPPVYPELKLIEGRAGIFIRTFFECPGCGRRRLSLFLAPGNPNIFNYLCRACIGLPYVCQRYSRGHPLRAINTYRKKRTKQKEMMRGGAIRNGPPKSRRKPWENPALLVQAKEFLPKLDGLTRESFEVILKIAENSLDKKIRDKAKRLLKKYVTRLSRIEKEPGDAKVIIIH